MILKTRAIFEERDFDSVYLVTEDEAILGQFERSFGSCLYYSDVKRYSVGNRYIWEDESMLSRSRKLNGMEYLSSMKLLSECGGLIGGVTGGTTGLLLLRDADYGYQYLFDLGMY